MGSMLDIIICTENIEIEIIKSIIIKRLIQIDRSIGVNYAGLKQEIKHFFQVEASADKKLARFWIQCCNQLDNV